MLWAGLNILNNLLQLKENQIRVIINCGVCAQCNTFPMADKIMGGPRCIGHPIITIVLILILVLLLYGLIVMITVQGCHCAVLVVPAV
jgi:hypothetical protein